jgi:hypothetical protein
LSAQQHRHTLLKHVLGSGGLVAAAGGCPPDQDAWFWLLEPPAVGLLAPMVMTAQRTVAALAYMAAELGKQLLDTA